MDGKCYCCQNVVKNVSTRSSIDHFRKCSKDKDGLLVCVTSGKYWLMLRCSSNVRMIDIDTVLKDIWLNCCDHLSVMYAEPNSTVYQNLGKTIAHEYDVDDTTYSLIKIIDGQVLPNDSQVAILEVIGRNILPGLGINSPRFGKCDYDGSKNVMIDDLYRKEINVQSHYNAKCKSYRRVSGEIRWRCKLCNRTYKKPYMIHHLKTQCGKGLTLVGIECYGYAGIEPSWVVFSVPPECKLKEVFENVSNIQLDPKRDIEMEARLKNIKPNEIDLGTLTILTILSVCNTAQSQNYQSFVQPDEAFLSHMTTIYPNEEHVGEA